ncbi:hypothetical protein I4U23_013928 [Adineta vaga]|nr:hypothetical protein I4U23_013928 [Adineta vaga]
MFIIDYIKLLEKVHSSERNILAIKVDKDIFLLPATLNYFSQRTNDLKIQLQRQMRSLAQKRRYKISKGIDAEHETINIQKISYIFNDDLPDRIDQLSKDISDKNARTMLGYIQAILDSFELYNDILTRKSSSNVTFCLLPILQNIHKQLCCLSRMIQNILDENSLMIKEHLSKLQEKLVSFHRNMKNNFDQYMSRDIRPPTLVIPCPPHTFSREIYTKIKSSNAFIDDDNDSDYTLTNVGSEDSLSK